jgi:hypothetical protein
VPEHTFPQRSLAPLIAPQVFQQLPWSTPNKEYLSLVPQGLVCVYNDRVLSLTSSTRIRKPSSFITAICGLLLCPLSSFLRKRQAVP